MIDKISKNSIESSLLRGSHYDDQLALPLLQDVVTYLFKAKETLLGQMKYCSTYESKDLLTMVYQLSTIEGILSFIAETREEMVKKLSGDEFKEDEELTDVEHF